MSRQKFEATPLPQMALGPEFQRETDSLLIVLGNSERAATGELRANTAEAEYGFNPEIKTINEIDTAFSLGGTRRSAHEG